MAEACDLQPHFFQFTDGLADAFRICLHKMRSSEDGGNRLLKTIMYTPDHVQDARMRAADQDAEPVAEIQNKADFVTEIVREKALSGQLNEAPGDGFEIAAPGER